VKQALVKKKLLRIATKPSKRPKKGEGERLKSVHRMVSQGRTKSCPSERSFLQGSARLFYFSNKQAPVKSRLVIFSIIFFVASIIAIDSCRKTPVLETTPLPFVNRPAFRSQRTTLQPTRLPNRLQLGRGFFLIIISLRWACFLWFLPSATGGIHHI
jgi:hypothetical protein